MRADHDPYPLWSVGLSETPQCANSPPHELKRHRFQELGYHSASFESKYPTTCRTAQYEERDDSAWMRPYNIRGLYAKKKRPGKRNNILNLTPSNRLCRLNSNSHWPFVLNRLNYQAPWLPACLGFRFSPEYHIAELQPSVLYLYCIHTLP